MNLEGMAGASRGCWGTDELCLHVQKQPVGVCLGWRTMACVSSKWTEQTLPKFLALLWD